MAYHKVESLPVFNNGRFVDELYYKDLLKFLGDKENAGNIYSHKLNFDLESVLILVNGEKKQNLQASIADYEYSPVRNPRIGQFIAIAMSLIVLIAITCFYTYSTRPRPTTFVHQQLPDSGKVMLTLANGKMVNVTDAKNGVLATTDGVEIIKTTSNTLTYKIIKTGLRLERGYHSISTPRGVHYQVLLSDGSKVWLNAVSSVKFPVRFEGLKDRRLSLNGQAYFEIAKDRLHPFLVVTKKQQIKVLGTHFDVNAYLDEGITKTTLLEGSVEVLPLRGNIAGEGVTIRPGQQAILSGDQDIEVKTVDAESTVAWKNGELVFRNEPLKDIMRELSRWYDVEVYYQNEAVEKELYGGVVSRSQNIAEVLSIMEQTGDLHFVMKGKKITVTR